MSKQFYINQIGLVQVQFQCQETVPFQIIQFSISTQFKFKYRISLAWARSLNVSTV